MSAANLFHAQPRTMVAVTGTAGKTSVASFVRQIWAQTGFAAAQIGTTGVIAPGRNDYGSLTTPDPVTLHRLLADLANEGVSHAAMEASSHGLDQRRLDGVKLAAGAFTNLGRDHMDYHPTVEHYFQSTMRLFDTLLPNGASAIIYSDDEWSGKAITVAKSASLDVCTVGRRGDFLSLKRVEHFRDKQVAEIHHSGEIFEVHLPLAGDFQIANAIVSAGLAIVTGVPAAKALQALHHIHGAPGRLELVGHTKDGALCYVDYAHKPDALEAALAALRPLTTGRLLLVIGAGGDRDSGKRPVMGAIAARLADVLVVTDDNPRTEDPAAIRAAVLAGARDVPEPERAEVLEIGSRREAIRRAIALATAGDTVLVAGKGHETGQETGRVVEPFDDRDEVRAALGERG